MNTMMLEPPVVDKAWAWVLKSLLQGSVLSTLLVERLEALPRAFLLGTAGSEDFPFSYALGLKEADVDSLAVRAFTNTAMCGGGSLIVESDFARKGDQCLAPDVAFVDDRVIRWTGLDGGGVEPVHLLRTGAAGYPLNAFVSALPVSELPLTPGTDLTRQEVEILAESVCAVIVAVFDAESFLFLTTATVGEGLSGAIVT
ncbi:MAG: hypothetical protein FWF25_07225 [Propionibacteriaceae bacterium]|nr:hypothetical protein [Propionibacteriaceae bacterium]